MAEKKWKLARRPTAAALDLTMMCALVGALCGFGSQAAAQSAASQQVVSGLRAAMEWGQPAQRRALRRILSSLAGSGQTSSVDPGPKPGPNQKNSAPAEPNQPSPVQVAAKKPDPAASAVTTTVSASEVQSLPASGRRWEEFVLETPAATAAAGSSQVSLRGSGQQPADVTVDGVSIRMAYGSGAGSSPGASGQPASAAGLSEPNGMGINIAAMVSGPSF